MNQNTGSCLCGKVRFSVSGEPARVGICHCLDCRKHHGALFYAAAIFPRVPSRWKAKRMLIKDGVSARIAAHPSLRAPEGRLKSIWVRLMPLANSSQHMNAGRRGGKPGCPGFQIQNVF